MRQRNKSHRGRIDSDDGQPPQGIVRGTSSSAKWLACARFERLASETGAALCVSSTLGQSCPTSPVMLLELLVAVGVFLSAHMTIVLHVASVKILADVIVVLNVVGR